jgi:hypothetical protein
MNHPQGYGCTAGKCAAFLLQPDCIGDNQCKESRDAALLERPMALRNTASNSHIENSLAQKIDVKSLISYAIPSKLQFPD